MNPPLAMPLVYRPTRLDVERERIHVLRERGIVHVRLPAPLCFSARGR